MKLLDILCGVPQGSILGPLLLFFYFNDIRVLDVRLFTDETILFASGNNLPELSVMINAELEKLNECFKINQLSLNVKKT